LVLGIYGRGHDQGAFGWNQKTGPNPTDRGKQGAKRSLLTEASGIPVGLAIDGANRHDMKLVKATLESISCGQEADGRQGTAVINNLT